MEMFNYKSKYSEHKDCVFQVGKYPNGNLAVEIWNDEGPITRVTVNPDIKIDPNSMIAIKDYSENEGMVEWLCKEGLINLDPVNVIHSGYVVIPVHTLTEKGKKAFSKS